MDTKIIAPTLLLSMFVMSGFNKLLTLDKTISNLQNKLNIDESLSKAGVYGVIVLEILAPIMILYYIINNQYKEYARYSVWGLIIFTIVVTFIYHPPDFSNYYKSLAFWANVSLVGGLLLLEKSL
jgi:uncharacterized membrane protein YphA (DoxX/SURF4 family)